ncbi:MAG: hypothetical protein LUC45_05775 [Paraprevotella sp.]|nr:hypothetical protein [Paraprevotella sp.]
MEPDMEISEFFLVEAHEADCRSHSSYIIEKETNAKMEKNKGFFCAKKRINLRRTADFSPQNATSFCGDPTSPARTVGLFLKLGTKPASGCDHKQTYLFT